MLLWIFLSDYGIINKALIKGAKGGMRMPQIRKGRNGSILGVREAVGGICSCTHFESECLTLPTKEGAQLSMTGDTSAFGNRCTVDEERLSMMLRVVTPMKNMRSIDAKRYAERRRFILLCGDKVCGVDKTVAIIGAISEMVRAGVTKIVLCTDEPEERYALVEALEVMRNVFGVTSYIPRAYDFGAKYTLSASVYSFLASPKPEVLVIGRDCITKRTNLVRQKHDGEESLTELIAKLHPVIVTASEKVSIGRSLADICEIFEPSLTFVFCDEVKRLRDAVIFVPSENDSYASAEGNDSDEPQQLSF